MSRSSGRTVQGRRRCSRRSSTSASRRQARSGSDTASWSATSRSRTVELDERGTVLECAQRATGLSRPDAQSLLGRFRSPAGTCTRSRSPSLGRRAAPARARALVASGANFLVLDEPTNHLDLESREALEEALDAFPGTVLLVSHDRALVDAVAERTLAIEDGRLNSYDGGWADYVRRRAELDAAGPEPVRQPARPAPKAGAAREPSRRRRSSSASRPRSRRRRRRSPSSSDSLRTTGRTSTRSPPIAAPAMSCRRCSGAGRRSSRPRRRPRRR